MMGVAFIPSFFKVLQVVTFREEFRWVQATIRDALLIWTQNYTKNSVIVCSLPNIFAFLLLFIKNKTHNLVGGFYSNST